MIWRIAVIVLLVAFCSTGVAAADGDPARDVLFLKNVFLPYRAPSPAAARALRDAVTQPDTRRFPVKVAVIASAQDLGSIPELFNQSTQYAKFLGSELSQFYVGPLPIAIRPGSGSTTVAVRPRPSRAF